MSYAIKEFQQHIFDLLTADATLMGKVTGVFDHVPQEQAPPFVTIGDITDNDRGNESHEGNLIDLTVHVWSENSSKIQCMDIQSDVDRILHRSDETDCTTATSLTIMDFHRVSANILKDPDNKTWHGVQVFEILTGRTT